MKVTLLYGFLAENGRYCGKDFSRIQKIQKIPRVFEIFKKFGESRAKRVRRERHKKNRRPPVIRVRRRNPESVN